MAEYIKQKIQGGKKSICDSCTHRNVCKAIDNQPCTECNHYQCTADVEPVVRCRECKHHYWVQEPCHGKSVHYCKLPHMRGIEIFKEFFCYYGEQKEGAD